MDLIISNTGYTGSIGFELYAENELNSNIMEKIIRYRM